jgi:hypothetical protein
MGSRSSLDAMEKEKFRILAENRTPIPRPYILYQVAIPANYNSSSVNLGNKVWFVGFFFFSKLYH